MNILVKPPVPVDTKSYSICMYLEFLESECYLCYQIPILTNINGLNNTRSVCVPGVSTHYILGGDGP